MKIAFDARELSTAQPPAGIGQYIDGLFSAMHEVSAQTQLYAYRHGSASPLVGAPSLDGADLSDKYFGKWSQTAWELFRWGRHVERSGCDLFHSTAHLIPGAMKRPLVMTVHDATNFLFPGWYRWSNQLNRSWHLRRGIRRAKQLIAVSKATRDDLCRLYPESASKIEVIYEGAESIFVPRADVGREQLGLMFEGPFILWVGTSSPRKNLKGLLAAFERVHEKSPEIQLVLIGKRGWKDHDIFDYAREHHLRSFVHPVGYQPREALPLFYSHCEAFVFPSLYEGFGLPVLEAMACGAPTLASNVSSLPELVPDERMLFDPSRPEEIAEKLLWVLQNPGVREELSAAGIERAKDFSWQKAARETLEVYKQALR